MRKILITLSALLLALTAQVAYANPADTADVFFVNTSKSSVMLKLDNAASDFNTCSMGNGCKKTPRIPSHSNGTMDNLSQPFQVYLYRYSAIHAPDFIAQCVSDSVLVPGKSYKVDITPASDVLAPPVCHVSVVS